MAWLSAGKSQKGSKIQGAKNPLCCLCWRMERTEPQNPFRNAKWPRELCIFPAFKALHFVASFAQAMTYICKRRNKHPGPQQEQILQMLMILLDTFSPSFSKSFGGSSHLLLCCRSLLYAGDSIDLPKEIWEIFASCSLRLHSFIGSCQYVRR